MPTDLRDSNSLKKWKNRTLVASIEFAITGTITAFREERNMRKHMVSAILASITGAVFRISAIEWLFSLLTIFLVVTSETINSAIENVADLASNYHFSMLAKNAKDMVAGTALVISGYVVLTGLIIFVPKIIALISSEQPKFS